jgi:hypothetical protein
MRQYGNIALLRLLLLLLLSSSSCSAPTVGAEAKLIDEQRDVVVLVDRLDLLSNRV